MSNRLFLLRCGPDWEGVPRSAGCAGRQSGHTEGLWRAPANVIVVNLARAAGYPISFMQFLRYGAVISVLTLMVSTAYLWLRYYSWQRFRTDQ